MHGKLDLLVLKLSHPWTIWKLDIEIHLHSLGYSNPKEINKNVKKIVNESVKAVEEFFDNEQLLFSKFGQYSTKYAFTTFNINTHCQHRSDIDPTAPGGSS